MPGRDHCLAPGRLGHGEPPHPGYGRMFGDLEPLHIDEAFFVTQGKAAVAGTDTTFVDLTSDEQTRTDLPAAGWPVFGQFVAHDLTADRSRLAARADPGELANAHTPRLNLETVYGLGPTDQPYLTQKSSPSLLLIGGDAEHPDLPRNQDGVALIGDPRNDVHGLMTRLQLAFLQAHNALVQRHAAAGAGEDECFELARRDLRWHFQWLVVHEFLDLSVGPELAAATRAGERPHFRPEAELLLPVEFADAAFRFGHSQVRDHYRLHADGPARSLFPDLAGFRPVVDRPVDWAMLFDMPGSAPAPQRAKAIDGRLVPSLIHLPLEVTGELASEEQQSLAVRDLQRGRATGLPSGEAIARRLGARVLDTDEIGVAHLGWEGETPLWYYLLKEAELLHDGRRLGPVGGCIVAEVLTAVVAADPDSYVNAEPSWTPTLPHEGDFTLGDLLSFAARPERCSA